MIEHVKFDGKHSSACLAKQLFLNDKKKKERMWLVCAAANTEVDLKALAKHLSVGAGNLRGAGEESLTKCLGAA